MKILGIDHVALFVRDVARYGEFMSWIGFQPSHEASVQAIERVRILRSGPCETRLIQPTSDGMVAHFLERHPDGVGRIAFRVTNVDEAAYELEERGGTFITEVGEIDGERAFDITTPIGDVVFRFVERAEVLKVDVGGSFAGFDHFTCHFNTMWPVIAWFEQVMGFERFWQFQFHTRTCDGAAKKPGTGMRSLVMRCPATGITFALNEPLRPDFQASQVRQFVHSNGGPGVQHVALGVPDICRAVARLQPQNFLTAPHCYYDGLGERLGGCTISEVRECVDELRRLGILLDGEGPGQYLLQIFMRPLEQLLADRKAGPFFFELIQRRGARGFGEGNFRALFECVAREEAMRT